MRNSLILAAGFLLAAPAAAQDAAQDEDGPTIVVTGRSLAETERALKDCIARRCPPDEDAAATIAHAENQFVSGDYKAARGTLLAGSGRNKRHAKAYPVPVSDLLRANSRVAAHLGEGEAYRVAALDVLGALQAGLGRDDPRVLVARVEVADSLFSFGRVDLAEQRYNDVVRDARRLGHPVVEAFAMLRIASMRAQLADDDPSRWRRRANEALDALIDSPTPEHGAFARAARVIKARLAAKAGDKGAIDAIIAELKGAPTTRPQLLYAEPIDLAEGSGRDSYQGSVTQRMATENYDNQWVDIGFWVAPDGRTTDIDILRQSEKFDKRWAAPVIKAIKSRRYAPLRLDPSDPGVLRVERYTYTARYTVNTGSRLRDRESNPRIEMLDLSTDEAPPAPAAVKAGR